MLVLQHPQVRRFDELSEQLRSLARFRRALRKEDQEAMDDMIVNAKTRWSLGDETPHLTPLEFILLSIIIGEHRWVDAHQEKLDNLRELLSR